MGTCFSGCVVGAVAAGVGNLDAPSARQGFPRVLFSSRRLRNVKLVYARQGFHSLEFWPRRSQATDQFEKLLGGAAQFWKG